MSARQKDRLHVPPRSQRPSIYLAVNENIGVCADFIFRRHEIAAFDFEIGFRNPYRRLTQKKSRMGGNAHMIVMQIPVAIKQKHIRLRLQLFRRLDDQRQLAKRKKTGHIRHADFPHAVHLFNDFFCISVNHDDTAHPVRFPVLLPIGEVDACACIDGFWMDDGG